MKNKMIAIFISFGLLSQIVHAEENFSHECMACEEQMPRGYFHDFYDMSPTFKHYWDKARKFERSTSKDYQDTISSNARATIRAFREIAEGRFDRFQEKCPYVSKSTYDQIQKIASNIHENKEASLLFHLFLYAKDFGWIDTGRPEFREIASAKIMEQIGAELDLEDHALLCYWMRERLAPVGIFAGEISLKKAEEILSVFAQKSSIYLDMFCLSSFLEAHSYLKSNSLIFEENAIFLAALADPSMHERILEEIQKKRLERICSAAVKNGQTTPEESLEIDRNTLVRKEALETSISYYSNEDQAKISRLLDNVDFHFLSETFSQMDPYSISRFLKISANLCYPIGIKSSIYGDIIYVGQNFADVFNRLFFLKMGEEEFIRRHVSVDPDTNWLVWNPEF